ncbi:cation-independent mannose-6-phosphate receptor isoform X2 [Uranotaenia lowii]|uniref:cation-independent mannose-6-phosphate receptor isoform X2 n=1 Tax=Uranotaenia lowii TaxID=190385 RepID=UPI00247AB5ED|nr:cation-independent mannose-6-phosphate receptor isoform X2 [Uranotaenia lowii]
MPLKMMTTSGGKSIWYGNNKRPLIAPHCHPHRCWSVLMLLSAAVGLLGLLFVDGTSAKSLSLTGENCILREPLYNNTFNLKGLDSELAHHISSDINDVFIFDVCDHLKVKCNGIENATACLRRKKGGEQVLAMESSLHLLDGRIHFNFSGGQSCKNGKNFSLDILMMCSYTPVGVPLTVIPYTQDQCNYFMFWTSPLVCLPLPEKVKQNECSVKDASGHVFNLLPLSHLNHHVPDRNGSHFFVAACKPVHYGHMTMCPPGSSVCHVNKAEDDYTKKYHDFGQTDPNPSLEGDKLVMNLKSGEGSCQDSKIIFECDPAAVEGSPEYVGQEKCCHIFSWRTQLACKKKESCAVVDPITGLLFNMTQLANKKYTVTASNSSYEFGICQLTDTKCPAKSGACQLTNNGSQTISLGTINDELSYNITGAPFLQYSSGSICKNDQRWSTKIEFICETDKDEKAPPKVVENSNCELIIQIETELACTKEISCSAMNLSSDQEVDLSLLISAEHNYEASINGSLDIAKDPKNKFFLNVCRPLLSTYGLGCPGGSAACMAVQGPNDPTPTKELSLGYPDVSLTIVGDRAQLKYLRGSNFSKDNSTQLSSEVEFYCQPKAGHGHPVLQEIMHDCHYRFEWATNVMCPDVAASFDGSQCTIKNTETSETVDLKKLFNNGELVINPSKNSVSQEMRDGKIRLCDKKITAVVGYKDAGVKFFFTVPDASCEGTGGNVNVNLRVGCGVEERFVVNEVRQ